MGLFGLFRRPRINNGPYTSFLGMDDRDLVRAVRSLITEIDQNGCLMLVVAFNLIDILLVWMTWRANKHPKKGLPKDIDGFIIFNSRSLLEVQEDIAVRRLHWFAMAGLVKKATTICIKNKYDDDSAFIWIRLASGGAIAEDALRHNIVWDHQEKSSFSHIHSERSGIDYILNHVMPSALRRNRTINDFSGEHDIFLGL